MDYGRKNLLQRMDGLIEWTGIPKLCRVNENKTVRRLKWMPAILILIATVALMLAVAVPAYPWVGLIAMVFPQSLSAGIAQLGPMRPKNALVEDVDEREQAWRSRSNMFTYGAIALVAWIGLIAIGGFAVWSGLEGWAIPAPNSPLYVFGLWLITFANYLLVLFAALPTLHASWTMPDLIEDEPEERRSVLKPRRR